MEKPVNYQIRVGSHLDENWAEWFNGLVITNEEDGSATINGFLPDQAALYGILIRIINLGLPLISVNQIQPPLH